MAGLKRAECVRCKTDEYVRYQEAEGDIACVQCGWARPYVPASYDSLGFKESKMYDVTTAGVSLTSRRAELIMPRSMRWATKRTDAEMLRGKEEEKVALRSQRWTCDQKNEIRRVVDRLCQRVSVDLVDSLYVGACVVFNRIMELRRDKGDQAIRLPKRRNVLHAGAILTAADGVPSLRGAFANDVCECTIPPVGDANKVKVEAFCKALQALDIVPREKRAASAVGQFTQTISIVCKKRRIAPNVVHIVRVTAEEAIDEMWVEGRRPDNAVGAAFVHVVLYCPRYRKEVQRAMHTYDVLVASGVLRESLLDLRDKVAVMEFAMDELGKLNPRTLATCVKIAGERHVCHKARNSKKRRKERGSVHS